MPSRTPRQHRAMEAAAHGRSTLGIPKAVGQEFADADDAPAGKGAKPMARKPIKIKKSHRGLLHKDLGIPQDQTIPGARLAQAMKSNPSPALKKRLVFDENFGHKR